MALRVYIAAPYPCRAEAVHVMEAIEGYGFEVTSTWLREAQDGQDENDSNARLDLADVARADVLVAINPEAYEQAGAGGRHVELGYALAFGKRIVLVGRRSNIFHQLSDVVRVERLTQLPEALELLATSLAR